MSLGGWKLSLGLTLASSSASVCNVVSSVSYDWLFAFSCSDMVSMPSMDMDDGFAGGMWLLCHIAITNDGASYWVERRNGDCH
jgi:hypothetical protein